jgi:hypothetical protein
MLTPGESVFVDTNVILYSVDAQSPVKRQQALSWLNFLWQSGQGRLSWQVLHEFYANAVRKAGLPVAQSHRPGRSLRFSPGGCHSASIWQSWSGDGNGWTRRRFLSGTA